MIFLLSCFITDFVQVISKDIDKLSIPLHKYYNEIIWSEKSVNSLTFLLNCVNLMRNLSSSFGLIYGRMNNSEYGVIYREMHRKPLLWQEIEIFTNVLFFGTLKGNKMVENHNKIINKVCFYKKTRLWFHSSLKVLYCNLLILSTFLNLIFGPGAKVLVWWILW